MTDTASHLHAASPDFKKGESAGHQVDSASLQAKVSLPGAVEGQRKDDRPDSLINYTNIKKINQKILILDNRRSYSVKSCSIKADNIKGRSTVYIYIIY